MPLFRKQNDVRSARLKQVGFAGIGGLIFLAVLVYGLPRPGPLPLPADTTGAHRQGSAAQIALREDTEMPSCSSPAAVDGVKGALVRTRQSRITGLSNVAQTAGAAGGNMDCRATVNLDFGSQQVTYTIRRLAPGRKTWELVLTEQ